MQVLTNAIIYTPLEVLQPGTIYTESGRIVRVSPGIDKKGEDLHGIAIAPGFIDVHIHGYGGYDTNAGTADTLQALSQTLLPHGVTSFIPSTVTASHKDLLRAAQATAEAIVVQERAAKPEGATILGLHLEGPYINREKKGAQNPAYIREPSWDEFLEYWQAAQGHIRTITVAPEVPGALEFIAKVAALGVTVSIGHTNATYEETKAAVVAGATRATHLFNAMPPIHHRRPGTVIACLESPQVYLELITDLVHVSAPMIRLSWRFARPERVALITDAIPAAGLPDGNYTLGDLYVRVEEGVPRLDSGALAGSTLTMDRAVRNLVSIGIRLQDSLIMTTYTPARACGVSDRGLLRPGNRADLVALDPDNLTVKRVYVAGERLL